MHKIAISYLFILVFSAISFAAFGQPGKISIDSFRVMNTAPGFVDIELVGSNDGSMGQLWMGMIAKSADGTVRPRGFSPAMVPVDKEFHIMWRVLRPYGLEAQKTDTLMVMIYPGGKPVIQTRKFDWHYVWPKKAANPDSAVEEFADLSTGYPWEIWNDNLGEEEFAALDIIMDKWNNVGERDKNGEWKLDSFRNVFVNFVTKNRKWRKDYKRIQKWRKFNPKSAAAAIAESKYWLAYALNIRGSVKQTDPVALRVFSERMQRAEQVLKDSKDYSANNPLWYEAYLDVVITHKRDYEFIETIYKEAIQRHPYFQPLYLKMASYWAPYSGKQADWGKVDEVIWQATENTATIDGEINYAMLYVQLDGMQKRETSLFEHSHFSWEKMRGAFEERVKRYPSMENLNEFAAYACRANDKKAFFSVRPRILNHILPNKWLNAYSYDLCDHRFMQVV